MCLCNGCDSGGGIDFYVQRKSSAEGREKNKLRILFIDHHRPAHEYTDDGIVDYAFSDLTRNVASHQLYENSTTLNSDSTLDSMILRCKKNKVEIAELCTYVWRRD